jgi:arylsulfatase A-like enzyme
MLVLLLSSCSQEDSKLHQGIAEHLPKAPGLNVLVISFDAMRADGMGLYGYHRNTTPNLDHFAQQALVFENAYSASPSTPTSFASPHTPYTHREISDHLAPLETQGRFWKEVPGHYDVMDDAELGRARALYDGEVFFADYLFGQLMQHLQQLDLADRTIVVVTADHGEEFMDHDKLGHKSLFEEVIRIPLLIRHPDAGKGARTAVPYLNIDLLPTLISMLGLEPPPGIDGLDLRAPFPAPRTRVVTSMAGKKLLRIAVEQEGRKLMQVCLPVFREELYDLTTDPDERANIVLDHPGLASNLSAALIRLTRAEPCQLILSTMGDQAQEELLSPEQIEQLRSLGYIQ